MAILGMPSQNTEHAIMTPEPLSLSFAPYDAALKVFGAVMFCSNAPTYGWGEFP
jgi:hypothetical protein